MNILRTTTWENDDLDSDAGSNSVFHEAWCMESMKMHVIHQH